jgi:hypothetical protein
MDNQKNVEPDIVQLSDCSKCPREMCHTPYQIHANHEWSSKKYADCNKPIEEIGGAIKNGKSRDTGNIRHKAQNVDKQNKKYYTENKKMSN